MKRPLLPAMLMAVMCLAPFSSAQAELFVKNAKQFPVGPNPCAIVARDMNGDGLPEIITADRGKMTDAGDERPANDEISYLQATGNLTYESKPRLKTDFAPWCLVAANMDTLKAPDIIVGSFHATRNRNITLFLNMGDGLFKEAQFGLQDKPFNYVRQRDIDGKPVFTSPGITSLAVADFNGDSLRDVVATGWCSDVLIYFPGNAETYLGEPVFIPASGGPVDIQAADVDGDGRLELVVAMYCSSEIALWKQDKTGEFVESDRFSSRGRLPEKVRIADVDGDGHLDIVVSHCHTDDSIVIFYGDGKGRFTLSQEIELGTDRSRLEQEIRDIVVTDLNGDGKVDIAAACATSGQVVVLANQSPGKGQPQEFRSERYTYDGAQPHALCAADLNGDGKQDLAVALWKSNSVALLLGR